MLLNQYLAASSKKLQLGKSSISRSTQKWFKKHRIKRSHSSHQNPTSQLTKEHVQEEDLEYLKTLRTRRHTVLKSGLRSIAQYFHLIKIGDFELINDKDIFS